MYLGSFKSRPTVSGLSLSTGFGVHALFDMLNMFASCTYYVRLNRFRVHFREKNLNKQHMVHMVYGLILRNTLVNQHYSATKWWQQEL